MPQALGVKTGHCSSMDTPSQSQMLADQVIFFTDSVRPDEDQVDSTRAAIDTSCIEGSNGPSSVHADCFPKAVERSVTCNELYR